MVKASKLWIAVVLAAALGGTMALAQGHVMQTVGEAKWGPAPPMVPKGAQIAVLAGDPTKAGAYTVRLKFPANYAIPAHSHPTDENVAVVSGALYMGMGDKLDEAATKELPAGSFVVMPAKQHHFALTKSETVIQLHGMGPWGITYVNPADDPRKAAASK